MSADLCIQKMLARPLGIGVREEPTLIEKFLELIPLRYEFANLGLGSYTQDSWILCGRVHRPGFDQFLAPPKRIFSNCKPHRQAHSGRHCERTLGGSSASV